MCAHLWPFIGQKHIKNIYIHQRQLHLLVKFIDGNKNTVSSARITRMTSLMIEPFGYLFICK